MENGPPRLTRPDTGLRMMVGLWIPNGGALRLRVGGGHEDGRVHLLWASCPLVHAPTSCPSGPWRAASARPGATLTALPPWWGLGSAQADGGLGVPRPRFGGGVS